MAIDCLKVIMESTNLSKQAAGKVLRDLTRDIRNKNLMGNPEAVAALATEAARLIRKKKALYARGARIEAVRLADGMGHADQFDSAFAGGKSYYVGGNEKIANAGGSVDASMRASEGEMLEGVLRDMNAPGHEGTMAAVAKSKEMSRKTVHEMHEPGSTGDADAAHAATVFDKWKEIIRKEANILGADINRIASHVFAQVHDPLRIAKTGFDQWSRDIMSWLDLDKTFEGQDPLPILKSIFGKIQDDNYNISRSGEAGQSLSERMSQQRFLQFKGAEEQITYNKAYGTGSDNAVEMMMIGLGRRAREVGMMQKMGPNPDRFHKNFVQALERNEIGRPVKKKLSESDARHLGYQYAALSGADRVVGNPFWANFSNWMRTWIGMSMLGNSTLSSVSDVPTAIARAEFNGRGYLQTVADIGGAPRKDPKFAPFVDSLTEGVMSSVAGRISHQDGTLGSASKWANLYFKANLLTPWTDFVKSGFAFTMGRELGDNARKAYSAVPKELKSNLLRYGIDEKNWDHIRSAPPETIEGKAWLSPEMIADKDTSRALRMFFMSEVDIAVPTPGARERALMIQGTRPGTIAGEAMRFAGQFKSFPVTMMTKMFPTARGMRGGGAVRLALGLMGAGYLSLSAKAIVAGREPPDPNDPRTIAAAMVQSGGMGIVGDLIFADFNATGRSAGEFLLGPAAGVAGDVGRLYSSLMRGEDVAGRSFSSLVRNTPFNNIFYARAAVNYLLVYNVQETLNPGYLKRMERRMKKESGTEWIIKPSDFIKRGGGFR